MARRSTLLFVGLMTSALVAYGQGSVDLAPKPSKRQPLQPYEAISFVSEGPTYGNTDEAVRGRYHRVLLVAGALAYDRPTIRLETLTYGDEGCCRKLIGAWDIDLEELTAGGIPLPKAETSELTFTRWVGAHTFEISYGTLRCRVSRVGQPKVTVSCKQ